MSKKENIARHSAAELHAMLAAGRIQTDWVAAAQKPLPDGSDPDDAMEHVDWATTGVPVPRRKEQFAGIEQTPIPSTAEEEADLDASLAEAERGEFATDEEVRAIWAKYGR
jgi:hypothetical protein